MKKTILKPDIFSQLGFSLIELMVYMAILGIIMAAITNTFTKLIGHTEQQSGIAETKLESSIGLDILRNDIEHAGYGLPWSFQNPSAQDPAVINYSEAATNPAVAYNDAPNGIPRAVVSGDNTGINNSDYLVIKSTIAAQSDTAQRWTYIVRDAANNVTVHTWGADDLTDSDKVIVIRPDAGNGSYRQLVMNGGAFWTNFSTAPFSPAFSPQNPGEYIIYGVGHDNNLRMPFNRADYFISNANVPAHCAPNTGVLEKATINQADGGQTFLPLMDCVADFQVAYRLDTNGDGVVDTITGANGLNGLTAEQIRDQLKEVRVYVLSHEGNMDRNYTYPNSKVIVGDDATTGHEFDLAATIGGNWQNYRWKVYTLSVKPENLR
ncbi:MAG: prepilin-type N-terminal cleavage/methylation domain-containing protein [Dissulfurimicrobium hydrothermale]|uniref:prepilin-type N-terminal cleavage/methylation domain-containing protein n=1 Tax=Dissulfurimicrobium hydrothermale TaxID=1750598 RepID=UPI003C72DC6E